MLQGRLDNAYALSRPPGHHCLPDFPNGFCLLNNIAIACEAARAAGLADRIRGDRTGTCTTATGPRRSITNAPTRWRSRSTRNAITPAIRAISRIVGAGAGAGLNLNIPLPPGGGHATYLEAFERLVIPQLHAFQPDVIVVACGFDASGVDPLGRMMAGSDTFRALTEMAMEAATDLAGASSS